MITICITIRKKFEQWTEYFYRIYLPYALKKHSDGSYTILNREYQPVGFPPLPFGSKHDTVRSIFLDINEQQAREISGVEFKGMEMIVLYNDATNPINGGLRMAEYLNRLAFLMKLKISYEPFDKIPS